LKNPLWIEKDFTDRHSELKEDIDENSQTENGLKLSISA